MNAANQPAPPSKTMQRTARSLVNKVTPKKNWRNRVMWGGRRTVLGVGYENDHPDSIARKLRPLCADWSDSYRAFLHVFLNAGYTISSYRAFDAARLNEKVLYLRHDIHHRDISGGLCMMDIERGLGITSTWYIMWDYRQFEVDRRDDFLLLREFGGDDFQFGLHEAVIDEYYFRKLFDDDTTDAMLAKKVRAAVRQLLNSDQLELLKASEFFVPSSESPNLLLYPEPENIPFNELREWVQFGRERLAQRLASFRHNFCDTDTISTHGGYVNAEIFPDYSDAPRFEETSGMIGQTWRLWTREFLDDLGIRHVPNRILTQYKLGAFDLCDGFNLEPLAFLGDARKLAAEHGKAAFALIHPYAWESGHFLPIVPEVLAEERRSSVGSRLGPQAVRPQAYSIYRVALEHSGATHFTDIHGDNWQQEKEPRETYSYVVGNVHERAGRVASLLAEVCSEDMWQDADLLDFGGGPGTVVGVLRCWHPIRNMTVLDINAEALDFQEQVHNLLGWKGLSTIHSSFDEWDPAADSYDIVLSYGSFEFFPTDAEITSVFEKVARCLRPGGVFVANVRNHHHPRQGYSGAPYCHRLPTQWLRRFAPWILSYGRPPSTFRSLSQGRFRAEFKRVRMTPPVFFKCISRKDSFEFSKMADNERAKFTHVWIVSFMPG